MTTATLALLSLIVVGVLLILAGAVFGTIEMLILLGLVVAVIVMITLIAQRGKA